jgi:hypothetical protein
MRRPLLAALAVMLVVVSCGRIAQSRLNPFNWFGRSERVETVAITPEAATPDGRQLVADVTALVIERNVGGAIIRATGLPPTQGFWEAELVPVPTEEEGVALFEFRVFPPPAPKAVSTPQSREITVAIYLSDIELEQIRKIVVQGASGARSARR